MKLTIITFFTMSLIANGQIPDDAVNFYNDADGIGARSQAMGNAFVGIADDYSATYWNPAGLAKMKRSEITGDLNYFRFNNNATYMGTISVDNQKATTLNAIGLAYKFPTSRGSLVMSLGYNRFKNYDGYMNLIGYSSLSNDLAFELEDDDGNWDYYNFDKDVRQNEKISESGYFSVTSIAAGLALSPRFYMGLTLNFHGGYHNYLFDYSQTDIHNLYNQYPADFYQYSQHQSIKSKFKGFNLKVGSMFLLTEELSLGLAIELPTSIHVNEIYSADDVLTFDDGYASEMDIGTGEWEYVINYPYKISGGVGLDLKTLLLGASFEYIDWSATQFDVPEGWGINQDYNDMLAENVYFAEDFRPVFSYSGGGELRVFGSGLKLRGGYRYVPSPYAGAEKNIDRQYYSAGIGYEFDKNAELNVSYTKGFYKRDTYDYLTPAVAHENITSERILAGLTYRF
jgi:long-subunit fatty acid transport protein